MHYRSHLALLLLYFLTLTPIHVVLRSSFILLEQNKSISVVIPIKSN